MGFANKFPGFASITVILPVFWCRQFFAFWVTVNRHQPFSSTAELPTPPAPVGPVEIAEEPVAGAVPVRAEMEPPPLVEVEIFLSPIVFWSCFFFVFLLHVFGTPSLFLRLASFVAWFSSYARQFLLLLAFLAYANFLSPAVVLVSTQC